MSAAIAVVMLLVACCGSDDEKSPTGSSTIDSPPMLPSPRVPIQPVIPAGVSAANEARAIVNAQWNMISYSTRTCATSIAAINSGEWSHAGIDCWSKLRGDPPGEGCSSLVSACLLGDRLQFSEVVSGTCQVGIGEFRTYDQWRHLLSTAHLDAQQGIFTEFEPGSEVAKQSWSWSLSSSPASGEWRFHHGVIEEASRFARLDWTTDNEGIVQVDWLWEKTGKWEAEVDSSGSSGTMIVHQWLSESSIWTLRHEIAWSDSHGSLKTYDDAGAISYETVW